MSEDMATGGGATEEYLTAEQAAQELVASLRDLREATEGYIAAEKRLEDVGKRLSELADATGKSGRRSPRRRRLCAPSSGPEILAQIGAARKVLDETRATLDSQHGAVAGEFAKQTADRGGTWQKQEAALLALARQVRTVTYIAAAGVLFAAAATVVALVK